jgi:hypothetical protein
MINGLGDDCDKVARVADRTARDTCAGGRRLLSERAGNCGDMSLDSGCEDSRGVRTDSRLVPGRRDEGDRSARSRGTRETRSVR